MPEFGGGPPPTVDSGGGGGVQSRMGGLPMWGWAAIVAAGGVGVFVWRSGSKPKTGNQTGMPVTPFQIVPDNTSGQYESVLALLRDIQGFESQPPVPGPTGPPGPAGPPGTPAPPKPTQPPPTIQPAPPPPPPQPAPAPAPQRTFTVRKWIKGGSYEGSSLWSIAQLVYGNPNRWREIYNANRNQISNPNVIHPGQVLVIP